MTAQGLIDTQEMYLRTVFELEEEGIVPLRARIAERLALGRRDRRHQFGQAGDGVAVRAAVGVAEQLVQPPLHAL